MKKQKNYTLFLFYSNQIYFPARNDLYATFSA